MSGTARHDAGFSLVEVIVELVIVALALTAFYRAVGDSYQAAARARLHEETLSLVRSHINSAGVEQALAQGFATGTYANGIGWRMSMTALGDATREATATVYRPFWVAIEAFDRSGRPMLRLETAKLTRMPP